MRFFLTNGTRVALVPNMRQDAFFTKVVRTRRHYGFVKRVTTQVTRKGQAIVRRRRGMAARSEQFTSIGGLFEKFLHFSFLFFLFEALFFLPLFFQLPSG